MELLSDTRFINSLCAGRCKFQLLLFMNINYPAWYRWTFTKHISQFEETLLQKIPPDIVTDSEDSQCGSEQCLGIMNNQCFIFTAT